MAYYEDFFDTGLDDCMYPDDMTQYEQEMIRKDTLIDLRNDLIRERFDSAKYEIEQLQYLSQFPEYSVARVYLDQLKELLNGK
jgi:ubiquinone biosynthesis protein Coq4